MKRLPNLMTLMTLGTLAALCWMPACSPTGPEPRTVRPVDPRRRVVPRKAPPPRRLSARAHFNQGVAWSRCGDHKKARAAYGAAVRAVDTYAPALVNLAELDTRAGRHQAAFGRFLKAFGAAPDNLDVNYNLAVLLQGRAQKGDAAPASLVAYWRGLRFHPKNAFDLAELHLRMVMAKSSAGKGVRFATLNLKAYNLGHLYMDYLNDRVKAGRWFSRYLGLPPKHTSPKGRKFAREQLTEIAYQDSVYCRMVTPAAKRRVCTKEAAARQARWRVIQRGNK